MSLVVVTTEVAPYMHRLYEALAARLAGPLHVLSCTHRSPHRQWDVAVPTSYRVEVLPGLRWSPNSVRNAYLNPGVGRRIAALAPDAVVVTDFSPTMLLAAWSARRRGVPVGLRTDGIPATDPGTRSPIHRAFRRLLVPMCDFGIGASAGSVELLRRLGLPADRLTLAPLAPAWRPSRPPPPRDARPFDVLFCGTLNEEVKGARFFVDVVLACLARGRRLTVRVTGDGPLRGEMAERFAAAGIAATFDGFVQQEALEAIHGSARLFLFPSRGDVWGLVVNEALQCGTPVVASPHAGAAHELVADYDCGEVRPLVADAWADAVVALLDDPVLWSRKAERARAALGYFPVERAVDGYLAPLRRIAPPLVTGHPAPGLSAA